MKQVIKMYKKLCDEYIEKNLDRICSLQAFLKFKYKHEKNPTKKSLIMDVIKYAETDF